MDVAINAGASALLVAETLSTEYAPPNASRGERWEAATMVLAEPCAVSCESGRGEIDAATLDASTVLGGLSGHCAASTRADRLGCASGLCAFSGPANHSHSQRSSRVREVCCVLETGSVQMAFPHAFNRSGGEQDARLPTQAGAQQQQQQQQRRQRHEAADPTGLLRLADVWPKARERVRFAP